MLPVTIFHFQALLYQYKNSREKHEAVYTVLRLKRVIKAKTTSIRISFQEPKDHCLSSALRQKVITSILVAN